MICVHYYGWNIDFQISSNSILGCKYVHDMVNCKRANNMIFEKNYWLDDWLNQIVTFKYFLILYCLFLHVHGGGCAVTYVGCGKHW
jgi:hypothetical protein